MVSPPICTRRRRQPEGGPPLECRAATARRAARAYRSCAICPSRHSVAGCALANSENRNYFPPYSTPARGAYASSRNVGWTAVDVEALTDERRRRGRRNRVVLAPQRLASSWRRCWRIAANEGGNRQGSPRRARISRKPLRREGRCDHRLYLWFSRLRKFLLREAPGCSGHPAFPAPSVCAEGQRCSKARAKRAARI